jgi:hypothetical protein
MAGTVPRGASSETGHIWPVFSAYGDNKIAEEKKQKPNKNCELRR